jgi:xanthine dehydrogenase small subunit
LPVRDVIRFILGDKPHEIRDIAPTTTVLEYLRANGLIGTKEGCNEGDCGACTCIVADEAGHKAVNACIMFVPALDGKQLITVEHLRAADGALHPVQQAMVDHHASQCGFCTPGFVMSLAALHQNNPSPTRAEVNDELAGNLCRCTGYRPIVDAALSVQPGPGFATPDFAALDTSEMLGIGTQYFAPRTVTELADTLLAYPSATIAAGTTDVGLWVTKLHRDLGTVVALDAVAEMRGVVEADGFIRIGAMATYEDAMAVLAAHYEDLGLLIRRIGSKQIRNRGTIGGNIANGSPIGDSPPALIALGALLVLRKGSEQRTIKLEDFFLGYRKTALTPGEFVERIDVPIPAPGAIFRCYKISKRFDQDISAVCAAFLITLSDGVVSTIRTGWGGMAATPAMAKQAEAAMLGKAWDEDTLLAAMEALDRDFTPLSDMRASATYRATVARNLLRKLYLETTTAGAPRLRLDVPA